MTRKEYYLGHIDYNCRILKMYLAEREDITNAQDVLKTLQYFVDRIQEAKVNGNLDEVLTS